MDVFRTDRIRNVVLLGHSGSGKTSLTEAMAYLSGMTNRLGKVTDGNTVSDFDKEEIKRKCSISTTLVQMCIRDRCWSWWDLGLFCSDRASCTGI